MVNIDKLDKRKVGRCGELLVQYWLLKLGIESASLTTDTGIDLIAFTNEREKPVATIQVKTSTHRGEGTWVQWGIPEDCPADYIAAVDLESNKFWFISMNEFKQKAQRAGKGRLGLWWYLPGYESKRVDRTEEQFKEYEMDAGVRRAFGIRCQDQPYSTQHSKWH